jgi:hypothetical protein
MFYVARPHGTLCGCEPLIRHATLGGVAICEHPGHSPAIETIIRADATALNHQPNMIKHTCRLSK